MSIHAFEAERGWDGRTDGDIWARRNIFSSTTLVVWEQIVTGNFVVWLLNSVSRDVLYPIECGASHLSPYTRYTRDVC